MVDANVRRWLSEFASDAGIEQADVHVDVLVPNAARKEWVAIALSSFASALSARQAMKLDALLAVQFYLVPTKTPTRPKVVALGDLAPLLASTPPELLVFRAAALPNWEGTNFSAFAEVGWPLAATVGRIVFQQWLNEDEEFDRRLFLLA